MPIPVIIITGFLGCGKTSFLRHLLPVCGELSLRPALIINEVGDVDVDGELLSDLHAEQVRLIGGCVCCTLQSQLSETIYDVLDREACDLILIECSGLSNPIDVVNALSAPALVSRIAVSHIICLLDVGRSAKVLNAIEIAKSQVAMSDVLILNKADTAESRDEVLVGLNGLGENAIRHWAEFGNIGEENLRSILTHGASIHCSCGCEHDHHHHSGHSHSLPASFCTVAMKLPEKVDRASLEALLSSLPQNVVRAKGFANVDSEGWQVLHKVYNSTDIYPHTSGAPITGPVLICIGQHLSADAIRGVVGDALKEL